MMVIILLFISVFVIGIIITISSKNKQLSHRPVTQAVTQVVTRPVIGQVPQPVIGPVTQPVIRPVIHQPVPQPVIQQAVPQPVIHQPVPQPVIQQAVPQPVIQQAVPQPVIQRPINCVGEWVDVGNIEMFINNNDTIENNIEKYVKERLTDMCDKKDSSIYEISTEARHVVKGIDINKGSICEDTWDELCDTGRELLQCLTDDRVNYIAKKDITRRRHDDGKKYKDGLRALELSECDRIECEGEWFDEGNIEKFINRKNAKEKMSMHNICNIKEHCVDNETSRNKYKKKRQIFNITKESKQGGIVCESDHGEMRTVECKDENVLCDINCVGEWSEWSECDRTLCGENKRVEQIRKYMIKQKKQGDGIECEYDDGQQETKTCLCDAIDCAGYFEDATECNISDFCDPFKSENQYKYKKQKFKRTQEAKYGGRECDYWDNEMTLKICDGKNGTTLSKCGVDCVEKAEIKSECSLDKCDIDPEQVVIKIGTQILKKSEGEGRECEKEDILTINCQNRCSPIDCEFTIGEFGECDKTDCNKKNNYYVEFDLKLNNTWFNGDALQIRLNSCKDKIIVVFSEFVNIPKKKIRITNIIENDNNTNITLRIDDVTKYKSELINNKLNSINISNEIAVDINEKIKCHRVKICDKSDNKYVCNTNGVIEKNCYIVDDNNNTEYCDVMESLTDDMLINNLNVLKNQNVVKTRSFYKTKEAKYGGTCDEPIGDLTTSCETECPSECVGVWEEYGGCNTSECPRGEAARGIHLKKKIRYRIINPAEGRGDECIDMIYGVGKVNNGQEIEIDCDELCPIDSVAEKQYSECNIFDECGIPNDDGTYSKEQALERQVKRRVIWKEIVKPQGRGRGHTNLPQLNEQLESCSPIVKCPINCMYK